MKHSIAPKTGTTSLSTLWCLIEGEVGIVGVGGGMLEKSPKSI